jgi:D-aminopeptidase
MAGTTWIEESGSFNPPVLLSNTHAVGACHTGVISWVNRVDPVLARQWLLPVCAETWDGYLNDINGGHVRPEHAEQALDVAAFVQANFGSRHELTVAGRHVGLQLAVDNPLAGDWFEHDMNRPPRGAGSVIAVIATDARCCPASARRSPGGFPWAWPAPAPPAATSRVTSSCRSPPPRSRIRPPASRSANPATSSAT